jgi:glycosyltransferase involved in cell wall biosynthesis
MHIGLDVTAAVSQGAGIGRYTRELLRALAQLDTQNQYRLFYASHTRPHALPPFGPNFRVRALPVHDIWLARVWHRAQLPIPVETFTGPVDIFHSPDFTLPPTRPGVKTLLTVHDLSFVRDPASAAPGLLKYLNTVVPRSVERAQHILADSLATKNDLQEIYAVPPEKITVLYSGVEARFRRASDAEQNAVRAKYHLGAEPFILAVGTLQPRKNYGRLIQAFAAVCPQLKAENYKLIIAGGKGWLFDSIFAEVEQRGLRERVLFPGFVADEDLPALYSAAHVFAYPSLYEGFGLPVLEAFACGTPVLTSTVSSLPEVAGEAALSVPPTDVTTLAEALHRLTTDDALRAELTAKGLGRAQTFTWQRAAQELLSIYNNQ